MEPIVIPAPLPMPFPYLEHPRVDMEDTPNCPFEQATWDYNDRFELYDTPQQRERLRKHESARLAGFMYTTGSDELLQVGSDFCLWAFAFDDEYCDEGPLSDNPSGLTQKCWELQRALGSVEHPPNGDKYALGLRSLRIRIDRS